MNIAFKSYKKAKFYCSSFIILSCLFITGCGKKVFAPVIDEGWGVPAVKRKANFNDQVRINKTQYYVVKAGDTLLKIAAETQVSTRALINLNHLPPPYKLYVGQQLQLSAAPIVVNTAPITVNNTAEVNASKKIAVPIAKPTPTSNSFVNTTTVQWQWPVQGKLVKTFSAQSNGSRGLDISNRYGTPILAAASGKVVYSGSGLTNYGNLIIIKHNDQYLSAYAYNKTLLVKEGQLVKAGQEIAEMGRNAAGDVLLHFEIRRNGKPINPLLYLKK